MTDNSIDYNFPYNYCPGYTDFRGREYNPFYCTVAILNWGSQYVFCCGNDTYRYCCKEAEKYYLGTQFSRCYLKILQYWPALLTLGLLAAFVAIMSCLRQARYSRIRRL